MDAVISRSFHAHFLGYWLGWVGEVAASARTFVALSPAGDDADNRHLPRYCRGFVGRLADIQRAFVRVFAVKITEELRGARLNLTRVAELLPMDAGHMRRLIRRGVFPAPKRTSRGKPYYDYELLLQVADVLKTGIGRNGQEIAFYRRRPRHSTARRRGSQPQGQPAPDSYLDAVAEGCRQLGLDGASITRDKLASLLLAEFGQERPPLERAIPAIARRLLEGRK